MKKEGYITGYEVYKDGVFLFEDTELLQIALKIGRTTVQPEHTREQIAKSIKLNQPTPCGHTFKVLY